jgi:ParB-like chromosome segregation protein Spo0J
MIIEKKKLSELKPAPYNPRQSTAKQEKHLKASLEKFGVVEPIIYNKQTGYIVGGHFRVRELTKLGYKEVECVIVDLNEEDERELNIRLNANTGEWDWDSLANEWDVEKLDDWGLDLPIIMDEPSLDELIGEEKNKPASMKITFKTVEQLQEAENDIQELIDRKYNGAFYSVSAGEL